MKSSQAVSLLAILSIPQSFGCGGDGPRVIRPTESYELTEQEHQNRERAKKVLAEQRQE